MSDRIWSQEQIAIRDWFATGSGNLIVQAFAGSGKTTTILYGIDNAPEKSILLCAFNKRIAEELVQRLHNPNAEAKTLHSLGYSLIRRNWDRVRVDGNRDLRLAEKVCGGDSAPDSIVKLVAKLAVALKERAPFATLDDAQALAYVVDTVPDPQWEEDGWDVREIAKCALAQLRESQKKDGSVSFSDMLYLPIAHKWLRGTYDLVVVDEAQDLNASQLLLARGVVKPGGRVCVVGDRYQSIYQFRGADANGMDRLKSELNAQELGLTTTYRCAANIVKQAQALVPGIQAAPNAAEGIVRDLHTSKLIEEANEGDFVLSRKNAPLAGICLSLLRSGKRARIEGRDIAAGLLALTRKWKVRDLDSWLQRLQTWGDREIARAANAGAESRCQLIEDQVETLRALCEGLATVPELVARINELFDDTNGNRQKVICSSIHKAKGLEAERVFLLVDTLYVSRGDSGEERNLDYVGKTRAQRELVLVSDGVKGKEDEKK